MCKKNVLIVVLILLNIALIIKQTILTTNILSSYIYASSNIEEKRVSNSDTEKYKIDVYYPISDYAVLNKEVTNLINNYINRFKSFIKDNDMVPNQYYTLNIFYNKYETSNYLSYVFRISEYTGGAHPNNTISTISYNKNNDAIITIESLIKDDATILDILSTESRKILENNQLFKSGLLYDMMIDGTKPKIENFKNFVFSKEGLIIFFEQYQIAPYSYGEFNVVIPYFKLKI